MGGTRRRLAVAAGTAAGNRAATPGHNRVTQENQRKRERKKVNNQYQPVGSELVRHERDVIAIVIVQLICH